ncbi:MULTISPECIES: type II secretion system secretin GspD [unclassified Wenzhouxiangella]|uniref:type II secretion system secretin GspD n=1 Tax=unclassified Wenzhouxiangella TaxID=2613841 RepID=UPI000E32A5BD|nr:MULTISPECIES: type II secretion system secretin GspD [unclassified Wenzhouxiangella]RFF26532.1 type II secretion system protein GspD [Wenzhouxiangella sp. 15181]RFP67521.1 type II secretion system protein GspD [Wenzhouxiangella sp. 15190]
MAELTRQSNIRNRPALAALLLASLTLAGCAAMGERDDDDSDTQLRPGESAVAPEKSEGDREGIRLGTGEGEADPEAQFEESETYSGTGVFIDDSAIKPRAESPGEGGEITLNFEGQGIQEIVHAILGQMFEENYIIAPGVSGEVTFSTAKPIKRDQVMDVLEMLLRWNGATLIWREGQYHVVPISNAVAGNLVPRMDSAGNARGYEVMAVPLEYISASKMAEMLEPWVREDAIFNADNARNLLFLAGTQFELSNYLQIIESFDVDWLEGMSVGIFNLERIEVDELLPELQGVFGEEGETPLAGMFRFMPLQRLNAVMVITPNEHYLDEAEKWIRRLDRSSPEGGSRLYVYRVKNLEADVLAGYLGDLFGSGSGRSRSRESGGGLAPGLERASASSVSDFQQSRAEGGSEGNDNNDNRNRNTAGGMSLGEEGDVRVTAIQETNSLLIQASPSEYDGILSAIERLDEEPLQVMIEAQVLIVDLTDDLQYGVSWFLANGSPDDSVPSLPEGFAPSRDANAIGFGGGRNVLGTITRRAVGRNFVSATINALESVSDVRTISSPSLMVRNNSDATINVGQQIPVQSTSFIGGSGEGNRFGSVQYLNTGVILEVTPRVNPGGLVYLQIRQEVSSPGTPAGEGSNPPVDTRTIQTEVAVQSGQTIMLGGLIEERTRESKSGVPGLQRIPVLGGLFRSTTDNLTRTETLVMITPTVVESTNQLKRVSDEVRGQFEALKPMRGRKN